MEDVALGFVHRAVTKDHKSGIIWIVQLDPRGETQFEFKCKHVNLVQNTHTPGESEYLFAPYSAFQVDQVRWSANPDDRTPHRIWITAFSDNRDAPEDCPLAPWY
mmetsp:Transcript_67949/g.159880  ORF Transcript_67949/g.159880 Transcript_67949/m.159880 type:complete len:105 (+) Transcript_67949:314-628(+)